MSTVKERTLEVLSSFGLMLYGLIAMAWIFPALVLIAIFGPPIYILFGKSILYEFIYYTSLGVLEDW